VLYVDRALRTVPDRPTDYPIRARHRVDPSAALSNNLAEAANARFQKAVRRIGHATSPNGRGKSLEELVAALFNLDATFRVWAIGYSMSDEEIDVVVANHGKSGFWLSLQSPLILVECKNWTKPVGSPEVRDFAGKLLNHHVLAKIGFLIAGSGFTSAATDAIRRMSRGDSLIVLLTLTDMLSFPAHDQCLADWLDGRIASLV